MTQGHESSPALGLLNFAWEYAEAAKKIANEPELKNVARFLICRSIELVLKAFLRAKGWEEDELRNKLRHNLQATLEEAEKAGLNEVCPIEHGFRICLVVQNTWYELKDFEYPFAAPELRTVWSPNVMDALLKGADDLREGVQKFIVRQPT